MGFFFFLPFHPHNQHFNQLADLMKHFKIIFHSYPLLFFLLSPLLMLLDQHCGPSLRTSARCVKHTLVLGCCHVTQSHMSHMHTLTPAPPYGCSLQVQKCKITHSCPDNHTREKVTRADSDANEEMASRKCPGQPPRSNTRRRTSLIV